MLAVSAKAQEAAPCMVHEPWRAREIRHGLSPVALWSPAMRQTQRYTPTFRFALDGDSALVGLLWLMGHSSDKSYTEA